LIALQAIAPDLGEESLDKGGFGGPFGEDIAGDPGAQTFEEF
jgi:hypothetical protein